MLKIFTNWIKLWKWRKRAFHFFNHFLWRGRRGILGQLIGSRSIKKSRENSRQPPAHIPALVFGSINICAWNWNCFKNPLLFTRHCRKGKNIAFRDTWLENQEFAEAQIFRWINLELKKRRGLALALHMYAVLRVTSLRAWFLTFKEFKVGAKHNLSSWGKKRDLCFLKRKWKRSS